MKIYETLLIVKYTDKISLNYKILRTEIRNPEILLSLKVSKRFLFVSYIPLAIINNDRQPASKSESG